MRPPSVTRVVLVRNASVERTVGTIIRGNSHWDATYFAAPIAGPSPTPYRPLPIHTSERDYLCNPLLFDRYQSFVAFLSGWCLRRNTYPAHSSKASLGVHQRCRLSVSFQWEVGRGLSYLRTINLHGKRQIQIWRKRLTSAARSI